MKRGLQAPGKLVVHCYSQVPISIFKAGLPSTVQPILVQSSQRPREIRLDCRSAAPDQWLRHRSYSPSNEAQPAQVKADEVGNEKFCTGTGAASLGVPEIEAGEEGAFKAAVERYIKSLWGKTEARKNRIAKYFNVKGNESCIPGVEAAVISRS